MKYPLRFIARIIIQFKTPFIIGGEPDYFSENVFISDPNGLPTIPGTSIAGVLRQALSRILADDEFNNLFGFQDEKKGAGSRLTFSYGYIHDSENRPVEGLLEKDKLHDPILIEALYPLTRDHVLINHRGTNANKYDEIRVAAGHRFTFEIMLEGNKKDIDKWELILATLLSDTIRIGGNSRSGYGSFDVISVKDGVYDLSSGDFDVYKDHPINLSSDLPANTHLKERLNDIKKTENDKLIEATIRLTPEGFWGIGGGVTDEEDISPLKERRIVWNENKADDILEILIPGSALKGALAHRIAYYSNSITETFLNDPENTNLEQNVGENNPSIRQLFGFSKSKDEGQRGRVIIDDIYTNTDDTTQKTLNHVSIDRFTGGAKTKSGALFNEKPLFKSPAFELRIIITEPDDIKSDARKALALTLRDLSEGLLPIGSGAGRGNGFLKTSEPVKWSDGGKWIKGDV